MLRREHGAHRVRVEHGDESPHAPITVDDVDVVDAVDLAASSTLSTSSTLSVPGGAQRPDTCWHHNCQLFIPCDDWS
jgi:hypothetical protein